MKWLGWSRRVGDVGLGIAVIAIVVMMVVPLTPALIDFLISINLGFSALLLSLALFVSHPLRFTAFPTLLLIATLYRLALNISSTRLILLQADAGRIIRTFGGYIVGGDILVGAVIFGILSLVLFLVITKGAERVAEVAARFSLDALPGMQLAIDSDVHTGAISPTEASRRRGALDEASRYYGALDGAMKFVRGDAIASLVIIVINIVGGLAVGMLRHGMNAGFAVNLYGRLTVGDGLVSMIPALLVSTAAGLLVTRVGPSEKGFHLGREINRQLRGEPRALAAAGALMAVLGFMPGLPLWPFLLLTVFFGGVAVHRFRIERTFGTESFADAEDGEFSGRDSSAVVIEISRELCSSLNESGSAFRFEKDLPASIGRLLSRDLGIPGARVLVIETDPPASGLVLCIKGVIRISIALPPSRTSEEITTILCRELLRNASYLVGMDETQRLLDEVSKVRPAAVRETVPKIISLPALTDLLGCLVKDRISLHALPEVLEIIARSNAKLSPSDLLECVREGLAPVITESALQGGLEIKAYLLGRDIESVLESGLTSTAKAPRLALSREDFSVIVGAIENTVDDPSAVLLAAPHLRAPLAHILATELDHIRVLKSTEIDPKAKVHILGTVSV
jgi:type III secretion protein V